MDKPFSKNQIVQVTITGITHDGNGIGRYGDMVVFVPLTAPGDIAEVKIVKILHSHAFGIVARIIAPSKARIENDCPFYSRCGGCSLRHISYAEETCIKEGWVRDNLSKIGKTGRIHFDSLTPSPLHARYRNKAQFPVRRVNGMIHTGFFAKRSHDLIPVRDCLLQPEAFKNIISAFIAFMEENDIEPYDEKSCSGLVRHLYLRRASATGAIMVCIILNGSSIPNESALSSLLVKTCPKIDAVILNVNRERGNAILGNKNRIIYGKGFITDIICGLSINISPGSFYQVNREGAELLYKKALEFAAPEPDDVLLDLYCGAGTIGLSMAGHVKKVIGVETVESAVENANQNASMNHISNASFILSDASSVNSLGLSPDIVVLDPPRKGAAKDTLEAVASMKPRKIVYISCDSATLARDVAYVSERGYSTKKAAVVDMFPRTAHVESVVLLTRKDS